MITKISVVIVAFDSGDYLNRAIASVNDAALYSEFIVDCCVIDNHPEGKDAQVSSRVSLYVHSMKNLGFGSGCNLGIKLCLEKFDSDYILLLNPDAALKSNYFVELEKMIRESTMPILGPVSPLILLDETLYKANFGNLLEIRQDEIITLIHGHENFQIYSEQGKLISEFTNAHVRVKGSYWLVSKDFPLPDSIYWIFGLNSSNTVNRSTLNVDEFSEGQIINNAGSYIHPPYIAGDIGYRDLYISENWTLERIRSTWCGACVLLSKEYLADVGNFDEDFFLYYEDIELGLRSTKKGFTTTFYPSLVCYHGHSKSTSKDMRSRSFNIWRSRALFVSKAYGINFSLVLIIKLFREIFKSRFSYAHLKHVRRNLSPEMRATLCGILRIK